MPLEAYIEIVPELTDLDTYVTFTVANPSCRASLKIYADMSELSEVAHALKKVNLESLHPESHKEFSLTDEFCMNYSFCVLPGEDGRKTFRALIVNDADTEHAYRAQIDINMEQSDADDLANKLLAWIDNPGTHFIWKL